MNTKRAKIESFRDKLRERSADTTYSNQFLYTVLVEHAKWLIKREISAGRIWRNVSFFQSLTCLDVIETSIIDACCPIKTNCTIFRTKDKMPELWQDDNGPLIKSVTSVDYSTTFFYTTPTAWQNKKEDPYNKKSSEKYVFFANGYLWFPEHNPHKINVYGFFTDDVSMVDTTCNPCKDKPCTQFLDTPFFFPEWVEAEMYAKALEQLAGVSKRLPEDEQIDKNPTRKN
jgi:hypothetical protein